ncbi:MAG: DUF6714 family protein [Kofleriaceae bacterium]
MTDREAALLAQIEAAFANVRYPGDDDLTNSTYGSEAEALVRDFRGKTDWRALSADFLNNAAEGCALSFFSHAALRFYLPAYLMADVRGELTSGDSPDGRLTISLTAQTSGKKIAKVWGGGTMGEHARRCFNQFDAAQAAAVTQYLLWKLEDPGCIDMTISEALENYWLARVYHS